MSAPDFDHCDPVGNDPEGVRTLRKLYSSRVEIGFTPEEAYDACMRDFLAGKVGKYYSQPEPAPGVP